MQSSKASVIGLVINHPISNSKHPAGGVGDEPFKYAKSR